MVRVVVKNYHTRPTMALGSHACHAHRPIMPTVLRYTFWAEIHHFSLRQKVTEIGLSGAFTG